MHALGGILGSIVAMLLTNTIDPRTTFIFYSFASLIPFVMIFFIHEVSVDRREQNSVLKHFCQPIVYKTVIYLILARSLVPHFGDIMYYFIINEVGFSKSVIAFITLTGFIALFIGSGLYNKFLRKIEYPNLMLSAQIVIAAIIALNFLFVSRISKEYLHINDLVFSIFTDGFAEIMY